MDAVIETRNLTKRYGDFAALNQADVAVRRGEIYGLVGDNGAGKTTLFKLLCGLAFPSDGEVRLFGAHAQSELERQRARMGAIIEQPGFFPHLSVEKNLEYYRIQKGVPGRRSVSDLLDLVHLSHAKKRACKSLSMGMKQRLGIAMALLGEPELLVLDEPTNGLDPSGIVEMRALLTRLNREKGITVMLSSHNLAELEQLATRYAFMSNGRILEQVSVEHLVARCADYIDIGVSDTERYTVLLEKKLGHAGYQVLPDATVRIFDPEHGIEAYSALAAEEGMVLSKLERKRMSLEQYYMDLKERGAA